jgi:hypothetical protein
LAAGSFFVVFMEISLLSGALENETSPIKPEPQLFDNSQKEFIRFSCQ